MSALRGPLQDASASTRDGLPATRFLSADECRALVKRVADMAHGGGETTLFLRSVWTGNLRWARNRVISSGDVRNNSITVIRTIRGAFGNSVTDQLDDARLLEAVRRAERMEAMARAGAYSTPPEPFVEEYLEPKIWFDSTYNQDAVARAELMHRLVAPAVSAGMQAAGYLEVSAEGQASMQGDRVWYYPYTQAQYSVTVRDPNGDGSGWAGVDWNDWARIDAEHLSEVALEKCLRSRNLVRLEPGRYTTILEPQAVGDLCARLFSPVGMDRELAEFGDPLSLKNSDPYKQYADGDPRLAIVPFGKGNGYSKLGERVIDERLTVTTDPMDPELGFPPFSGWEVYHPVTWVRDGVLAELSYGRRYAVQKLGQNTGGLPLFGSLWNGAFHMRAKGEAVSIDEMIETTRRGVLVTRFSDVSVPPVNMPSLLLSGYTRDGLWLVENGKITKAVKNFRFTESPLFALNNVEQIGVPQRIFSPGIPVVVPALKVRDFSFTALTDAV